MDSKKKKKKKKVLYRKQINKILAIPGQMTAKEFEDIILLKPLPRIVGDEEFKHPEVFKGDSAPQMSNPESDEAVRRTWQNEMDNDLFDL